MRKALLADDDFLVRSYLKMLSSWEKAGFEITADVRDGEEALEVLDREKIDLVVTDIAMPLMDGIELIREIRRKYPDIYVIVLSCHDEFEYVKKAMKEGADEYVLKNTLNEESLYTVLEAAEEHIRQSKEEAGVKDQKQQTQEHADMKKDPEEDNNADADGKTGEKSDQTGNMNEKFLFFNQILAGTLSGEEREEKRIRAGIRKSLIRYRTFRILWRRPTGNGEEIRRQNQTCTSERHQKRHGRESKERRIKFLRRSQNGNVHSTWRRRY